RRPGGLGEGLRPGPSGGGARRQANGRCHVTFPGAGGEQGGRERETTGALAADLAGRGQTCDARPVDEPDSWGPRRDSGDVATDGAGRPRPHHQRPRRRPRGDPREEEACSSHVDLQSSLTEDGRQGRGGALGAEMAAPLKVGLDYAESASDAAVVSPSIVEHRQAVPERWVLRQVHPVRWGGEAVSTSTRRCRWTRTKSRRMRRGAS